MGRGAISAVDQVLRASNEVIKYVLLARKIACLVPFLTVFATAAQIGDGIDTALVQPDASEGPEKEGAHADLISAIAFQQCRISASECCPFATNDIQGHTRAIFGNGKLAHDFHVIEADRGSLNQRRA